MRQKKKIWGLCVCCVVLMMAVPQRVAYAADDFKIDGYYDDWEGIPKTKITYGSYNANEYHELSVVMDGEYLYGYVRLSDVYQTQIPVNEYHLTINGKTKVFNFLGRNEDSTVDWGYDVYDLAEGTYLEEIGAFHRDNARVMVGEAAITITSGIPNDTIEFRMKLSALEELYGFPEGAITNGAKIEFYNPNLGSQKAELAGSASGAAVVAVIGVVSVGAAWFVGRKRKRMVR